MEKISYVMKEIIPVEVYYGYWLSVLSDFIYPNPLGGYVRWFSFFIMTALIMNYFCKEWAINIRHYANKKYPDKKKEV